MSGFSPSERESFLPPKEPRVQKLVAIGHRRHFSADNYITIPDEQQNVTDKLQTALNSSASAGKMSELSNPKLLREAAGNLKKISLPASHYTMPSSTYNNASTPPATSSPIGNILHNGEKAALSDGTTPFADIAHIKVFLPYMLNDTLFEDEASGIQLDVEGGQYMRTDSIINLISLKFLDVQYETSKEAFSLWMISPNLELQLKDHHSPVAVRQSWQDILRRFANDITEDEIENDEPVLFFKRNVLLTLEREKQLIQSNKTILNLLWMDARVVLFTGRYLMSPEDSAKLAGIGFVIESLIKKTNFTNDHMRKNLDDQLPEFLANKIRGRVLFGKPLSNTSALKILWDTYSSYRNIDDSFGEDDKISMLKQRYLDILHSSAPSYGCAFFSGNMEKPSTGKFIKRFVQSYTTGIPKLKLRVGVNRNYIIIDDEEKNENLLVQDIRDCSWAAPKLPDNDVYGNPQYRFLLSFDNYSESESDNSDSSETISLLQIFGKQVVLINTMLTYSSAMIKISNTSGSEESDGTSMSCASSPGSSKDVKRQPSFTNSHRLSLLTLKGKEEDPQYVANCGTFMKMVPSLHSVAPTRG